MRRNLVFQFSAYSMVAWIGIALLYLLIAPFEPDSDKMQSLEGVRTLLDALLVFSAACCLVLWLLCWTRLRELRALPPLIKVAFYSLMIFAIPIGSIGAWMLIEKVEKKS